MAARKTKTRKVTRKKRSFTNLSIVDAIMSPGKKPTRKASSKADEIIKKEILQDVSVVNVQVNQIILTIGSTPKAEDQYSLRQQMLDLLRFKYSILENY